MGLQEHVVGTRELRDHVSQVLRQVEAGERFTVTVAGRPVAELTPVRATGWTPRVEVARLVGRSQADAALSAELDRLAGDELDDLP